ncbi:reverse transcriptase domain, reverse transcriptase zinc-binding domain protein [Tanacetum coccineum]
MGDFVGLGGGRSGVWGDIVRVGRDIDRLGVCFSSSFTRKVGDGSCVSFWDDRWDGGVRLRDRFPRLYHLDRCKVVKVAERGVWGEEGDTWNWELDDDGVFSVKRLASVVESKCLNVGVTNFETIWNKLIPQKINIFAWRTVRGRLPVRVELDKKGINLHSVLCPVCDNACESIDHGIVLCGEVMKVWSLVFGWWHLGNVNAFTAYDMLNHNGGGGMSPKNIALWQAVVWTTGYFIWRNRNCQVFGKKFESHINLFQEIQLMSYEWIRRRSSKYKLRWDVWLVDPRSCMA